MNKLTIKKFAFNHETVLVRVDFNVPFKPGTNEITDDSRISASIPTLKYLLEQGCKVVVCSHLGRPMGRVTEKLRMTPISTRLSKLIGSDVNQLDQLVGHDVKNAILTSSPGEIIMLENLRFDVREERNDPGFSEELASLADVYVNDAFGVAHRSHASVVGIAAYLPAIAGMLMDKEISMLSRVFLEPKRPLVAILGGAKVADKVKILDSFACNVDKLLIGGGMAANFLEANGINVGSSLTREKDVEIARTFIDKITGIDIELYLPKDVVISEEFSPKSRYQVVSTDTIPEGWMIMDVGPYTVKEYKGALMDASTVVWNGPLGVFEWAPFANGTRQIARAVSELDGAQTIIGGGSTSEVVTKLGLGSDMTHVSTGGGASLEFLEGQDLPGISALMDRT